MKVSAAQIAYFSAALTIGALLLATARGKSRQLYANLLLVVMTGFVAFFLYTAYNQSKASAGTGVASADQAEMKLRIVALAKAVQDHLPALPKNKELEKKDRDDQKRAEKDAFDSAEESLRKALERSPESTGLKTKLIVVLGTKNNSEHRGEIKELVEQLRTGKGAADPRQKNLAMALTSAFVLESLPHAEIDPAVKAVRTSLKSAWYRDQTLFAIYKNAGDRNALAKQQDVSHKRYLMTFYKLLAAAAVIVVCGLTGLVTLFVLGATAGRRKVERPDEVGLDIDFRTVYAVLLSWFSLQIIITFFVHLTGENFPKLSSDPLATALNTFTSYAVCNLPGILLIYYLALKPRGLRFVEAMRLNWRSPPVSRFRLVLAGFLGWCTAIPIVASTAIVAQFLLGTKGSDNPVLGQIVQAANSSSLYATIVFQLTLGLLAPIFEEILFRGFLYQSLKPKIGFVLSVFLSALFFAAIHFDPGGLPMLFAIGAILAVVFDKTRSLIPAIICHGLWNTGTFCLALIIFSS